MSLQYLQDFDSERAHDDVVLACCWTKRGAVITGSLAGDIRVWDAAKGRQVARSPKHASPHIVGVNCLTISQNEDRLLSSSVDGSVALWDIKNVEAIDIDQDEEDESTIKPIQLIGKVSSLAGTQAANKILHLSSQGDSTLQKGLESFTAVLHPDGMHFATTGAWAAVSIYSCEELDDFAKPMFRMGTAPIVTRASQNAGSIDGPFGTKLAYSPNGELLALGDDKGQVHVFDTLTNRCVVKFGDHLAPIRALAFSGNAKAVDSLFVGGDDCIITIHDVKTNNGPPSGRSVGSLRSHKAWITDLQPSADGRLLASSSFDGTIRIWDLKARPKTTVCLISQDSVPWTLAWKALDERPRAETVRGSSSMTAASASAHYASAFVTGSEDGLVRWYRAAGVTPNES